jgi:hypothetical protein
VKYSLVPDPSLVKGVKYSSLTILFSHRFGFYSERRVRVQIWRFSAERAHCEGENNSIWIQKVVSGRDIVLGTFSIPGVTYSWNYWGFHAPYLFIFIAGRIIA